MSGGKFFLLSIRMHVEVTQVTEAFLNKTRECKKQGRPKAKQDQKQIETKSKTSAGILSVWSSASDPAGTGLERCKFSFVMFNNPSPKTPQIPALLVNGSQNCEDISGDPQ